MNDPDMGIWNYSYNILGQLISQTDAKNQSTTFTYDVLGRKTSKNSADGISTWTYDSASNAIGSLALESFESSSNNNTTSNKKEYFYDTLSRPIKVITTTDDIAYTQSYTYDAYSRVETRSEPNDFIIKNTYNERGYLKSIKSPKSQILDFDIEHFKNLIENTLQSQIKYHQQSNELLRKSNEIRAKAQQYEDIAHSYYNSSNKEALASLIQISKTLKIHALKLDESALYYANWAKYFKEKSDSYLSKIAQSNINDDIIYQWLSNIYKEYSSEHLLIAATALNQAQVSLTDISTSNFEDTVSLYINQAQTSLTQSSQDQQKSDFYRNKTNYATKLDGEYEETLEDRNYNYFYRVLKQDSFGRVISHMSGNGLITNKTYENSGVLSSITTRYDFSENIRELKFEYNKQNNVAVDKF